MMLEQSFQESHNILRDNLFLNGRELNFPYKKGDDSIDVIFSMSYPFILTHKLNIMNPDLLFLTM